MTNRDQVQRINTRTRYQNRFNRYPPLDDEGAGTGSFLSSLSSNRVFTVPLKEVESEWGHPEHLTGLVSTVCVFSDVLTQVNIQTLHNYRGCGIVGVVCVINGY